MNKKYRVRLTDEERNYLEKLDRKGKAYARKLLYARVLLKADEDGPVWSYERIADALEVSAATVARERRRYCEEGLEVALLPKKLGKPRRRVLDGRAGVPWLTSLVLIPTSASCERRSARCAWEAAPRCLTGASTFGASLANRVPLLKTSILSFLTAGFSGRDLHRLMRIRSLDEGPV